MSASEIQAKITYKEKNQQKMPLQRKKDLKGERAQDGDRCGLLHAVHMKRNERNLSNLTA